MIAVSKTFKEHDILPLLDYGHCDFGENKVQEALLKWPNLKEKYKNVNLHMLGKLQTNKAKFKGSAIFLHLTKKYLPTKGCIALCEKDFLILAKLIDKKTKIKIN